MKIKIAILINDFFFNNYETFYKILKSHPDTFDCLVIATEGYSDKNKNSHAISKYLTSIGVENIDSNKNDVIFSLENYKPDYVFYLVPYDCYFPEEYHSDKVSKYSKVCLISYGASMIKNTGIYEDLKNNTFYNNATFIFVETKYKLDFGEYTKKFVPIGYMKLDKYFYFEKELDKKNNRKKIVWKPRWTLESDSNYWQEVESLYNFIKQHDELDFYTYYHPLFVEKIKEKGYMEKYTTIHEKMLQLSNYFECEYSTFLDTVLNCDILISDHSSTLVEFAATGKPIIYCQSSVELNDLGNAIISNNYISTSASETIEILENLLKGIDPKKELREKNKRTYYFFPDGCESISNYLIHFIETDYLQSIAIKLRLSNKNLKEHQKKLENNYEKLCYQNETLIDDKKKLENNFEELRSENEKLDVSKARLENEYKDLQMQNQILKKNFDDLTKQQQELKVINQDLEKRQKKLKKDKKYLNKVIYELNKKIEMDENELKEIKNSFLYKCKNFFRR